MRARPRVVCIYAWRACVRACVVRACVRACVDVCLVCVRACACGCAGTSVGTFVANGLRPDLVPKVAPDPHRGFDVRALFISAPRAVAWRGVAWRGVAWRGVACADVLHGSRCECAEMVMLVDVAVRRGLAACIGWFAAWLMKAGYDVLCVCVL